MPIFYSAPRTETPKLDRLMRLVSTCTEYEAHELIRIVNDSSVVLYPFDCRLISAGFLTVLSYTFSCSIRIFSNDSSISLSVLLC